MQKLKKGMLVRRTRGCFKGMLGGDTDIVMWTEKLGGENLLSLKKFGQGHNAANFKPIYLENV